MRHHLRKILPLIVLFIFAYPFVQKELHVFEHSHDFHCASKTERHIHPEQHHCLVCEYNILPSETAALAVLKAEPTKVNTEVISFYKESSILHHKYSFLLRGPPIL